MFSALAENHGNLNSKISSFVALAPVASLNHDQPEDLDIKFILDNIAHFSKLLNLHEVGPGILDNKLIYASLPKDIVSKLSDKHASGASLK